MPTGDRVTAGTSNRTQVDKLLDFLSSKDFGGVSDGVTNDTAAINSGISFLATTYGGGVLYIPQDTVYTEANLVTHTNVMLFEHTVSGKIKLLLHDYGSSLPIVNGGLEIKTKGKDGVILSSHDSGVSGFPYLRIIEAVTGQLASMYALNSLLAGYTEYVESATPSPPAQNKARLFCQDNGVGKTQLCVRFNTGNVVVIATQP